MFQIIGHDCVDTAALNAMFSAAVGVSIDKIIPTGLTELQRQILYLGKLRDLNVDLKTVLLTTDITEKYSVSTITVVTDSVLQKILELTKLSVIAKETLEPTHKFIYIVGTLAQYRDAVIFSRTIQSPFYSQFIKELFNEFCAKGLRNLWADCNTDIDLKGKLIVRQN